MPIDRPPAGCAGESIETEERNVMTKRLIVCCDGTWNTADRVKNGRPCPTNVIRMAVSIAPIDPGGVEQRVYYHPGVGTGRWDRLRGGAFGAGLSANVVDAYRFLIDNYEPGDELYLFGFSRGAYTARSVGGLVRKCGVLRRENHERAEEAYRLYRSWATRPRGMTSSLFRSAFSYEPDIRFIGVWDTVGALGIPSLGPKLLEGLAARINKRWSFHDTELSTKVRAAFQALAVDEHRAAFKPTLWTQRPDAEDQVLEQVWFSGAHSDIGGGLSNTSLSDLALLWMVAKAQEFDLAFLPDAFRTRTTGVADGDPDATSEFTVDPHVDCLPHDSRRGLFALAPAWNRPIGLLDGENGGPAQRIADSALQLRQRMPDRYKAPELERYLTEHDPPQVEPVPMTYTPHAQNPPSDLRLAH